MDLELRADDEPPNDSQLDNQPIAQLCSRCAQMPWGPEAWKDFHTGDSFRTHLKWQDAPDGTLKRYICYELEPQTLYSAEARSCDWCYELRAGLRLPDELDRLKVSGNPIDNISVAMEYVAPGNVLPVRICRLRIRTLLSHKDGYAPANMELSVMAKPGGPASKCFFSPIADQTYDGGFDSELARRWMYDCGEGHRTCAANDESSSLPTRILDLSESSTTVLLRDARPDEVGRYACLSYKWGAHHRHDFAEIARSAYNKPLEISELPGTLRDAIRVTRGLRLDLLWIDALCIWQDDPADLRLELSAMHNYYTRATIVVQSSGTDSVDEGFLDGERRSAVASTLEDSVRNGFVKFPYRSSAGSGMEKAKAIEDGRQDGEREKDDGEDDAIFLNIPSFAPCYHDSTEPAAKRGWIFQEQQLCRRMLIFPSGGGMIFRCNSAAAEISDGNVLYDPWLPVTESWTKEKLMSEEELKTGPYPYLGGMTGRTGYMLNSTRRLVAAGNKAARMNLVGSNVEIVLDLDHDRGEKKENRVRGEDEEGQGVNEEIQKDTHESASAEEADGAEEDTEGRGRRSRQIERQSSRGEKKKADEDSGAGSNTRDHIASIIPIYLNLHHADGTEDRRPPTEHPFVRLVSPRGEGVFITGPPFGRALPDSIHGTWKRLVTKYCARSLSFPGDKLVAMAALSREHLERYGAALGAYQAGLWTQYAASGLLWYARYPMAPPPTYVAPSWSWAAVSGAKYSDPDGEIEGGADFQPFDLEVLRCETTPDENSPPLGAVVGGWMEVRGLTFDAWWGPREGEPEGTGSTTVFGDDGLEIDRCGRVWADHAEVCPAKERQEVKLLLVRRYISGIGHNEHHDAEILVLRERPEGGFVRIGFADILLRDYDSHWRPRLTEEELRIN